MTRSIVGRRRVPLFTTRTDADGRATVPLVRWPLAALSAPGRERVVVRLHRHRRGQRDEATEVHLGPGHEVRGRVVDRAGAPVAGAEVIVAPWHRPSPIGLEELLPRAACDDGGRFCVRGVGAGMRRIFVARAGRPLLRWAGVRVPLAEQVLVEMLAVGTIEGTVVESGSDVPIAGACVWFNPWPWEFAQIGVRTDGAGRYRAEGVQAGSVWSPSAERRGYVPGRAIGEAGRGNARVPTDGVLHVDFALDRGAVVTGRVTCGGAPVAEATVAVWISISHYDDHQVLRTTTDANGSWRVEGAGAGSGVVLVDAAGMTQIDEPSVFGGYDREHPEMRPGGIVVPASGEVRRDVEMRRGEEADGAPTVSSRPMLRVTGRVIGADGRPPREARLRIARWSRTSTNNREFRESHALAPPIHADGSIDAEQAITGHAIVWAESLETPGSRSRVVRLPRGRDSAGLTLELCPPVLLRGRVTSSGSPVAGSRVHVRGRRDRGSSRLRALADDHLDIHAISDADGRFVATVARAGTYGVHVQARGLCAAVLRDVRAPGEEIEFDLAPSGEISGRLVWPDGTPCAGAIVEAIFGRSQHRGGWDAAANEGPGWAVAGEDGCFVLRGLPVGAPVAVQIDRPSRSRLDLRLCRSPSIDVGTRGIQLRVLRGRTFAGRAVDATGRPVPKTHVLVWSALRTTDRWGIRFDTTDADGRFVVNGLWDPPWSVETYVDPGPSRVAGPRDLRELRVLQAGTFSDERPAELVVPNPHLSDSRPAF
jgi:protocatechuate 3,4-dioxygenase beta subunit